MTQDPRAVAREVLAKIVCRTMVSLKTVQADIIMETIASALADERRQGMEAAAKVVTLYKLPTGDSIMGDHVNDFLNHIATDIHAQAAQEAPHEG